MSPLDELRVVHHPEAAEVVLVPDETLVQRQIRADCVLQTEAKEGAGQEKKGKKKAKLVRVRVI